jgi:hypothetical protein
MIMSHLGQPFAESPETVLSGARGLLERHALISDIIDFLPRHAVARCLGQDGVAWRFRDEYHCTVLGIEPTVFRVPGLSSSVLDRGAELCAFLTDGPCPDVSGRTVGGTLFLCDDGWFVLRKTPGGAPSLLPFDSSEALLLCRRLSGDGAYDCVAAIRTALCAFFSFYMKGAPKSWGPLLDEVASTVTAIDDLLAARRRLP